MNATPTAQSRPYHDGVYTSVTATFTHAKEQAQRVEFNWEDRASVRNFASQTSRLLDDGYTVALRLTSTQPHPLFIPDMLRKDISIPDGLVRPVFVAFFSPACCDNSDVEWYIVDFNDKAAVSSFATRSDANVRSGLLSCIRALYVK